MKPLINNQILRIDSHQRGDGRPMDITSVHIHKKTKQPILVNGKRKKVEIEIPLYGDKQPHIVANQQELENIPGVLKEEIQEALSRPQKVIAFAKEVANILQNYAEWEPEQLVDALRRVADIVGIQWSKEQLHTFSSEALGFTCYLQLLDNLDHKWYELKVNNRGFQIENTMRELPVDYSRPRYIIADCGHGYMGKSTSIKGVWNILSNKYPNNLIKDDGDVQGVVNINNCLIGIESQGDPDSRMPESIDDFEQIGCDIILTACRTRGETYNKLFELYFWYNYEIILAPNPHPYYYKHNVPKPMLFDMDFEYSSALAQIIECMVQKYI